MHIALPDTTKFNQQRTMYNLYVPEDNYKNSIQYEPSRAIAIAGEYSTKGLSISMDNPFHINTTLFVYEGKKLINQGEVTECNL